MAIWRNLQKNKDLLNAAAASGAFVIFDTETTGLSKDAQIIEFAGSKCRWTKDGGFTPYETLHLYVRPDAPVPPKASEVNGLTDEFLADKPDERVAYAAIRTFLGGAPVVGAYNSPFDVKMLKGMYARNGDAFEAGLEVDLLKVAKDVFAESDLPDRKLGTIAKSYGVDEGISFHSASDDVEVLIRVTNAMIRDMKAAVPAALARIPVWRLNYVEGFRGNSSLYATTPYGSLRYSFRTDSWSPGKNGPDPSTIDMNDVEDQVFRMAGCADYVGLRRAARAGAFS